MRHKKTTRKLRPSPFVRGIVVPVADLDVPAVVPVTVNKVTCDGNTPGGFRVESVPVQPGQEV